MIRLLGIALVALLTAIAVVALCQRRSVTSTLNSQLSVAVFVLWLYSAGSAELALRSTGRMSPTLGAPVAVESVNILRTYCMLTAMLICVFILAQAYNEKVVTDFEGLIVLVLPFIILTTLVVVSQSTLGLGFAMFMLFSYTCWVIPIDTSVLRTVGYLTICIAAVSVAYGVLQPDYATAVRGVGLEDTKAIIGDKLLAGPFASPNTLGLLLAIGFPTVLAIRNKWILWLGAAVVIYALVWSSSRSSIFAVAFGFAGYILIRLHLKRAVAVGIFKFSVVTTSISVVIIPILYRNNELDFTGRGRIWSGSLNAVSGRWIEGAGPDFYQDLYEVRNTLGPTAFHGHNLFITLLVTGGLFVVLSFAYMVWYMARRCIDVFSDYPECGAWLISLLAASVLESTIDFRSPGYLGWVTWPMLALLVVGRPEYTSSKCASGQTPAAMAVAKQDRRCRTSEIPFANARSHNRAVKRD